MAQRIGGETRMAIAKRVLHDVIAAIPEREGINVGFRLYGHRGDNSAAGKAVSCRSSELLVPIEGVDQEALEDAVDAARATGWTPLAASLEPRRRRTSRPPSAGVVNAVVLADRRPRDLRRRPLRRGGRGSRPPTSRSRPTSSPSPSPPRSAPSSSASPRTATASCSGADDADELAAALFTILEELEVVDATGILEIEAFGDVWPAATATCAGRVSDSRPRRASA